MLGSRRILTGLGGVPFWFAFPFVVSAQGFVPPQNPGLPVDDLPAGIAGIIRVALLLVGVLALGFIVYGGFAYITSRGDERGVEAAKATITTAVTGIVIIGLAYAIVEFVFCAVGTPGPFCP